MEPKEYVRMYEIEDKHWWYVSIHQLLLGTLQSLPLPGNVNILDAGCGTGGLSNRARIFGEITSLDYSELAVNLARNRNLDLIQSSINSLPLPDRYYDVAMCISVLDQKSIDKEIALNELRRVLKLNGMLLLVVSAYKRLYSHHDLVVNTKERFSFKGVNRLVEQQGFKIIKSHYIFSFLFPVFLAKRMADRLFPAKYAVSDLTLPAKPINEVLKRLCLAEWKTSKLLPLPFGSSILILAQKTS
jgi:ubiquinone/menaquinone biosynthesis C-methylase UbiE